ncbi:hypothetical protein LCGC14_3100580, partial [marine sediment metagenome]
MNDVVVVAVEIGSSPERQIVPRPVFYKRVSKFVRGTVEKVLYPRQLKGKFTVLVNGNGLLERYPLNRWGLRSNFIVSSVSSGGNPKSLTDNQVERIMRDLKEDEGYLNPNAGVDIQHGIWFNSRSLPAPQFQAQGETWKPQLHFTGAFVPDEINFIEWLINRYVSNVVAHHIY